MPELETALYDAEDGHSYFWRIAKIYSTIFCFLMVSTKTGIRLSSDYDTQCFLFPKEQVVRGERGFYKNGMRGKS